MACVLEAGEGGGALECVTEYVDSLVGVRATDVFRTAEIVVGEAADKEHSAFAASKAPDANASTWTQSPCRVQGAGGQPEARQLRLWQRLGQLEDARHVFAEVVA